MKKTNKISKQTGL